MSAFVQVDREVLLRILERAKELVDEDSPLWFLTAVQMAAFDVFEHREAEDYVEIHVTYIVNLVVEILGIILEEFNDWQRAAVGQNTINALNLVLERLGVQDEN